MCNLDIRNISSKVLPVSKLNSGSNCISHIQQKSIWRLVAMVFFAIILFISIVSMIVLPSEEYKAKGGFIMPMIGIPKN